MNYDLPIALSQTCKTMNFRFLSLTYIIFSYINDYFFLGNYKYLNNYFYKYKLGIFHCLGGLTIQNDHVIKVY